MSIKKNLAYNSLLSLSQLLYPIVTFPYVARVLEPEGMGTYNFVESVARYFILIAALGTPIYGVRQIAIYKGNVIEIGKTFREIFTVNIITTLSCCLLYLIVIPFLPGFELNIKLYYIGLFYILFNGITSEWYFIGREDFRFLFLRTVVVRVLMVISVFLFVQKPTDLGKYFLINTLSFVGLGVVNLIYIVREIKRPMLKFRKLKDSFKHLKPLFFIFSSIFAVSVYILFDTILLRLFTNDENVGYYTAATKLNKVIVTFLAAISTVLLPKLSNAFKSKNIQLAENYVEKSLQLTLFICFPAVIFTFSLSEELILLFSGKAYLPAVSTMRILTPIILIIGLTNVFGLQILNSIGRDKEFLKAVLFGAFISLLFNFILIPKIGLNGAAISNLSAEFFVLVMTYLYSRNEVCIKVDRIACFKILVTSLTFIPVIFIVKSFGLSPIVTIVSSLMIGSFVYFVANFIMDNKLLKSVLHQYQKTYLKK